MALPSLLPLQSILNPAARDRALQNGFATTGLSGAAGARFQNSSLTWLFGGGGVAQFLAMWASWVSSKHGIWLMREEEIQHREKGNHGVFYDLVSKVTNVITSTIILLVSNNLLSSAHKHREENWPPPLKKKCVGLFFKKIYSSTNFLAYPTGSTFKIL